MTMNKSLCSCNKRIFDDNIVDKALKENKTYVMIVAVTSGLLICIFNFPPIRCLKDDKYCSCEL